MKRKTVLLLFCVVCFFNPNRCSGSSENNSSFVATDSWKVIEEGQAIPAGLHVRINLQTGKKEAKLLDKESKENSKSSLISLDQKHDEPLDLNKLKEALKDIKADDGAIFESGGNQYRSYDDLKKDFEEIQMHIKTDAEILTGLVNAFFNITKENGIQILDATQLIAILNDLEYLVHQYDNAVEFANLNGFSKIIVPSLNISGSSDLRMSALLLLGSAVQNNPRVQRSALDAGCVSALLKVLALDNNSTHRNRGLFALSCLIRSFPAVQLKFVQEGGISVLSTLFDDTKHSSEKNRHKMVALLTDLLLESKESVTSMNPVRKEQYELVGLEQYLRDQGWCKRASDWLCQQVRWKDIQKMGEEDLDHSAVEAATDLILGLSNTCLEDFFTNIELHNVVNHVKEFYSDLVLRELDEGLNDSYYSELLRKLRALAVALARTAEFKDEL